MLNNYDTVLDWYSVEVILGLLGLVFVFLEHFLPWFNLRNSFS